MPLAPALAAYPRTQTCHKMNQKYFISTCHTDTWPPWLFILASGAKSVYKASVSRPLVPTEVFILIFVPSQRSGTESWAGTGFWRITWHQPWCWGWWRGGVTSWFSLGMSLGICCQCYECCDTMSQFALPMWWPMREQCSFFTLLSNVVYHLILVTYFSSI